MAPRFVLRATILARVAAALSLVAACEPPHECCRVPLAAGTIRARAADAAESEADQEIDAAEADEPSESAGPPGATGRAVAAVLAWRDRASPSYQPQVDAWLTVHISLFAQMDTRQLIGSTTRLADTLPYGAPYHQAERAYALWIVETRPDLSDAAFANALFALSEHTLPTLDRLALARDYLAAQRPLKALTGYFRGTTKGGADLDRLLVDPTNAKGLRHAYREALGGSVASEEKERAPIGRCRSSVTTPFFDERFAFTRLWTELEDDEPAWLEGVRALIDLRVKGEESFATVLGDMWNRFPLRHGVLLYVIASLTDNDRYSDFRSARAHWVEDYGRFPYPMEFDQMLAFDPRAALVLPRIVAVPASSPHAGELVRAVRALDADPNRLRYAGDPSVKSAVSTVAEDMCIWGQDADLATLKKELADEGIDVSVNQTTCQRKRAWAEQGNAPALAQLKFGTDC